MKNNNLLKKVCETLSKYHMLCSGDRVITALSGGPDSVFLIHALNKLKKNLNISLFAFHLNHGLRGEEADRDMEFCKNLCERLKIPIQTAKRDAASFAREKGLSVEEAGHHLRYSIYRDMLTFFKADKIATGHTFDDQAETVLMRLLSGAGKKGLAGIAPVREDCIIRPLIEVRKREILDFLERSGIEYKTDLTNLDESMMRNRIRKILIPLLKEKFNPQIEENLCRIATIFQEELTYLDETSDSLLNRFAKINGNRGVLNIEETLSLSPFIAKYLIRRFISDFSGSLRDISWEHTNNLYELLENRSGSSVILPGGLKAEREYRFLVVSRLNKEDESDVLPEIRLNIPGVTQSREWGVSIKGEIFEYVPQNIGDNPYSIYLDYDECRDREFILRARKEGDRFTPLGMKGSKKVKDFFIDQKVPRRLRENIPIVVCGNDILWVAFYRQSHICRINEKTKRVLNLQIEKISGDI